MMSGYNKMNTAIRRVLLRGVCQGGVAAVVIASAFSVSSAAASEENFIRAFTASPPPTGARQLCGQYTWACASKSAAVISGPREMDLIRAINRKVNATTREVTDQSQYRTAERWALPTSRGGDCEDFALLKKRDLIRAGVDPTKLLIATVLDRNRQAHAVLVYRSANGDLILDNLTNRIKPWSDTRYLFLRMQDPRQPEKWVGIYRKS